MWLNFALQIDLTNFVGYSGKDLVNRKAFRTFLIDCFVLIFRSVSYSMLTARGDCTKSRKFDLLHNKPSNPGEQHAAKKLQFLKKVAKMQCKPFLADFFLPFCM